VFELSSGGYYLPAGDGTWMTTNPDKVDALVCEVQLGNKYRFWSKPLRAKADVWRQSWWRELLRRQPPSWTVILEADEKSSNGIRAAE
jgi:hypothetical protein